MTQGKHTPGPWSPGCKNINVVAVNAKIGGETPVCDIRGWGYLTGNGHGALGLPADEAVAIQEANARLIAAAPEMLEALRDALGAIRSASRALSEEHKLVLGGKPWGGRDIAAIEAVIAKAEGRS